VLPALAGKLGVPVAEAEALLWTTYQPGQVWWTFAMMGFVSMVGLLAYDRVVRAQLAQETAVLIALMTAVTAISYGPTYGGIFLVLGLVGAGLRYARPPGPASQPQSPA
jgi:hypothetical protein